MTEPTLPAARDYFDGTVSHLRDQAEQAFRLADCLDAVLSGDYPEPRPHPRAEYVGGGVPQRW